MSLIVNIEKRLGNFLLRADFEMACETLAALGESGAGKTLLLKCIAGIERPDKGKIILDGRVLFDSEKRINLTPQKRRVGFLFQECALFPNMTLLQNVLCAAKTQEARSAAAAYIKRFGLGQKENLYPAALSGGERQRAALARLLVSEPKVFLLDEPFSALDSNRKSELERLLLELLEEKKRPAILVTHDRNEAFRLCSKIAFVERGKFSRPVEKREFFESPATVAAARLSGCKNISRLKWLSDDTAYALDWGIKIRAAGSGAGVCQTIPAAQDGAVRPSGAVGQPAAVAQASAVRPSSAVCQTGAGPASSVLVNQNISAGQNISGNQEAAPKPPFAGFRAHYLELCQDQDAAAENVFTCDIKRVIEDAFSYTVYFAQERPQGGESWACNNSGGVSTEPAPIAWEVEKSLWKKIEASVGQQKIRARIPFDKMMLLEGEE